MMSKDGESSCIRNKDEFDRNFPPLLPPTPKPAVLFKSFNNHKLKSEIRRAGSDLSKNGIPGSTPTTSPNSWSDDEVQRLTDCQISELQNIVDALPYKDMNEKQKFREYLTDCGLLEAMSSALMNLRIRASGDEMPTDLIGGFCEKLSQNCPEKRKFDSLNKEKADLEIQLEELTEQNKCLTEMCDRRISDQKWNTKVKNEQ